MMTEKAIANANQLTGAVIYMDGLGHNKKIGTATVMMVNGMEIQMLHYHLGSEMKHTVYKAEAITVILALHTLTTLKRKLKKVTIGTDNQAVLMGLQNQRSKHSNYLLDKIYNMMEDFQVMQKQNRGRQVEGYKKRVGRTHLKDGSMGWIEWRLKVKYKVKYVWTPGHEDIDGNKQADEAALGVRGPETSDYMLRTLRALVE